MPGSYEPSWNSLVTHPLARWFRDAKFGIYTHWGVYSVPACGPNGTWYPHFMYGQEDPERGEAQFRHHVETYGPPSEFGYKDFIPMFTAEKFDPEEWAELFRNAGARFAGPVAEHHDGFSMWDSQVSEWNAARMGPKRDIVGELERAIRGQGMRFLTTFHHAYNWWFFPTWNQDFDCSNPEYAGLYTRPHARDERPDQAYLERWKAKIFEVIDAYRPDLIWFDFGLRFIREDYRKQVLAYYYNQEKEWGREVVVTHKYHDFPPGAALADFEVGKMEELTYHPWITDTTVDAGPRGTWSHVHDIGYKSVERLVHNLIDRVSKNGYLLLNVGPRADGTIPEQAQECLLGVGKWLEVNGEAIYGTTPWLTSGEGPTKTEGGGHFNEMNEVRLTAHDIRFTSKGNALYAICLGRPGDRVTIRYLRRLYESEISSVEMLGVEGELRWTLHPKTGLTIETPPEMPCEHAHVFKVTRV